MQDKSDAQLLREYANGGVEPSFGEIVTRHTDLVYSAAVRQVGSATLACDVAQSVFTDLARKARPLADKLPEGGSLAGWLYRSTRFAALNQLRDDRRRLANERLAMEQLITNSGTEPDWERVRPVLDEAMADLGEEDREALLLRFFKNQDLRAVGHALGVSDDAAQKRVSRALEKLREQLTSRGVTATAVALSTVLSANAITVAPAGLAATLSGVALAGTAIASTTTTIGSIAMTTLQKTLITATIAAAVGVGIYEARQVARLSDENRHLRDQEQRQASLGEQVQQLQRERDDATTRLAAATEELAAVKKQPSEVHKLRGQVGVLRQEKDAIASKSPFDSAYSNPEARKLMRDMQKMGMGAIYADLIKGLKLEPEVSEKFKDLLADQVMDGIDLITQVLHDKSSAPEMDRLFSEWEMAAQEKVRALVGPEGLAQYQEYKKNLTSTMTAAELEGSLTGDKAAKAEKKKQLALVVQEETRAALTAAGRPADFQAIPMLNFRNIASETEATENLKLLDSIYDRVAARGSSFLDEKEMKKFQEYRTNAIKNSQTLLLMNRKMMAPIAK